MDPVIEEINRASGPPTRQDVFRRWQQYLVNVIQPQLDELEALKVAQQTAKAPAKGTRV